MIVVTGATGRTGRALASTLLSRGERVRLVTRSPEGGSTLRGAETAIAELQDTRAMERAFASATAAYLLIPEDLAVPDMAAHRETIARALAQAVRKSRIPRVVLLSALAACLPDGNGPARALHVAENLLRDTGCQLTVLRATYFQENVLAGLAPARHSGVYPNFFASRDLTIPMIAARDVGEIAARVLMQGAERSEVIDLLGPPYSAAQVARCLSAALARPVEPVDIPRGAQVAALTEAGLPPAFAESLAELYAAFASGAVRPQGDRSLAGTTPLEATLTRALAHSALPIESKQPTTMVQS